MRASQRFGRAGERARGSSRVAGEGGLVGWPGRAAPTHCSGDLARRLFAEAYGVDYVEAGVGLRMQLAS